MVFECVITNGRVLDPASGIDGLYDIAVSAGRIAGVFPQGAWQQIGSASHILSAADCYVTPGLIDLHTHVFDQETDLGIHADQVGIEQGVTTVVDAGSAGADTLDRFVAQVAQANDTGVLAWLNIARQGLSEGRSELADISQLQQQPIVAALRRHASIIRGIKVRMSSSVLGNSGIAPLVLAKSIAAQVGLPIMVHIGNVPPKLADILDLLGAGDVVTHAFHGKAGGILAADGTPIPQLEQAICRGVKLDVGHGTSSFSFRTMNRALTSGIRPHSISTDIYLGNYPGPVHSLLTTLSKFLALGLTLPEVIAAATIGPAKILGLDLGTLALGSVADISILQVLNTDMDYIDSEGDHLVGRQQLLPVYTIKAGKVFICK